MVTSAFDSNDVFDRKRLRQAMDWSLDKLRPFREARGEFVRNYAGSFYGRVPGGHGHHHDGYHDRDTEGIGRLPVNWMELATTIFMQSIASQLPQALITTPYKTLKPHAADLELVVNHVLRIIGFEKTLETVIRDALFGMGIVKIGVAAESIVQMGNESLQIGQPYVRSIDQDDWIFDMAAKQWDDIDFAGNRYGQRIDEIREDPRNDPRVVATLQPVEPGEEQRNSNDGIERISRDRAYADNTYKPRVELWDMWLPAERLLVTMTADDDLKTLRVLEWNEETGPENGPFRVFGFQEVSNNIMPLAPASLWIALHKLANRLYVKLGDQADRQKTVLPVPGAAIKDGERAISTADGEAFLVEHGATGLKEIRFGGIDPGNLLFQQDVSANLSKHAGNLESLGGLGPQSDTVGQEKMISDSASGRIRSMQSKAVNFTADIITDVAWHVYNEPSELAIFTVSKEMPRPLGPVEVVWSSADRKGAFLDYNFKIAPYSMQHKTPSDKLQTLTFVFKEYILPAAQMGVQPDMEAILKLVGKYADMDEINEIIQFAIPTAEDLRGPVGGHERTMPANTTRTVERVNRPGATRDGNRSILQNATLGGGAQQSELASLGRSIG